VIAIDFGAVAGRCAALNPAILARWAPNLLQPIWRDGKLLKDWTFDQVR
jgi:hypothetical protein